MVLSRLSFESEVTDAANVQESLGRGWRRCPISRGPTCGALGRRRSSPLNDTMTVSDWWNRTRYSLYAPVYDWVAKPLARGRKRAIERLDLERGDRVLILGCGPGSDLDYLPEGVSVTAVDLSPAMIRRTEARAETLGVDVDARVGDARDLPFEDDTFDAVLLHLVLSVVPDAEQVATEADRVLAPDGRASIYDKFVPEGESPSLLRRALNPVTRFLFSDVTKQLGALLAETTLQVSDRESFLGGLYTVTVARPANGDETGDANRESSVSQRNR
jgi:phosphatidylethanolamine/phosphatidyl-N-methylethanolamine N-methyltransferase